MVRRFGAVTFDDPFEWLEADSAEALAWEQLRDEASGVRLRALPRYQEMYDRIEAMGPANEIAAPKYAGGRWFVQRFSEDSDFAVLEATTELEKRGRTLLDLNLMESEQPRRLQWFVPSPDGGKVALSWAEGASQRFQVIDAESGDVVLDGLPQQRPTFPAWTCEGDAFFYRAESANREGAVFFHRLGAPAAAEPELLALTHPISWPVSSADGGYTLIYANHLAPRPDYIRDNAKGGEWQPFLRDASGSFRGVIIDDAFVAISDDGASRGRLISIPLQTPLDRSGWRELLAPSDAVLGTVERVGERIVIAEFVDAASRLRVLRKDGKIDGEIALPARGVVSTTGSMTIPMNFVECFNAAGPETIAFVFSSLTESPAIVTASVVTKACRYVTKPAARLAAVVTDATAMSADGTPVRYRVISRAYRHGRAPTVLLVYGGFNVAMLCGWPGDMLASWVEAGGVLAVAHIRGGGEFGTDWWRAGHRSNRPRSLEDVYAVAEALESRGVTSREQLAVHGVSNGGMVAAAVAIARPELFAAAVPQLPVTDMFGLVRDPITYMIAKIEDGDPNDATMSELLLAWSPYHNVVEGLPYPAMLIDCAVDDPRCPPWHGRKLAARMSDATSSGRPVLLRVRPGTAAVGKEERHEQYAERLAFLAKELGL